MCLARANCTCMGICSAWGYPPSRSRKPVESARARTVSITERKAFGAPAAQESGTWKTDSKLAGLSTSFGPAGGRLPDSNDGSMSTVSFGTHGETWWLATFSENAYRCTRHGSRALCGIPRAVFPCDHPSPPATSARSWHCAYRSWC